MRRERGVVLISAIIMVALATVIATTLFFDTAMFARRGAANFSMEQGLQLAQGAEALAAYALREDKNQTDSGRDVWANHVGPLEVAAEVSIEAQLADEQAKFNINTLLKPDGSADADAVAVFSRLLELLNLDTRFAALTVDWLDPDDLPQTSGGEDSLYSTQKPAHRTGNVLVSSISELQQLPGLTRAMYVQLAAHITALPLTADKVNVCTADGYVLDSFFALSTQNRNNIEYSRMAAEELERNRAQACFPGASVLASGEKKISDRIAEKSSHFRLYTWVRIGTAEFALYSLMYRDSSGQARPIVRTFGTE
jgi:general secretion pathway protein K